MSSGRSLFPSHRHGEADRPGQGLPEDHHHAVRPARAAVACLVLMAQLWVGACASVGPAPTPSKRDLVSVAFTEPRLVRSETGQTFLVRSLVGDVERVTADTVHLRIADATEAEGRPTEPLFGLRVPVERSEARLTVIDEDRSGVTMAATLLATLGALAAGAFLGYFGLDYE